MTLNEIVAAYIREYLDAARAEMDRITLKDGYRLPQIYYALPQDAEELMRRRSKGVLFETFKEIAIASAGKHDRASEPDALEFLHGCLCQLIALAARLVERSPVASRPIVITKDDIIGEIKVTQGSRCTLQTKITRNLESRHRQMNTCKILLALTAFNFALPLSAQLTQAQMETYSFHDLRLGMSIAEFKTKHPVPKIDRFGGPDSKLSGQSACTESFKSIDIVQCRYTETYESVPLKVTAMFAAGKLALIEVLPPFDHGDCFEPPPAEGTSAAYFYSVSCTSYKPLLLTLGNLGPMTLTVSPQEQFRDLHVIRWDTTSAVAELQVHMCGPWNGTDVGWSKAISEVLEGSYCSSGDLLSSRQPVLLFIHKGLGSTLARGLDGTGH